MGIFSRSREMISCCGDPGCSASPWSGVASRVGQPVPPWSAFVARGVEGLGVGAVVEVVVAGVATSGREIGPIR